jgi:hypothetical protein
LPCDSKLSFISNTPLSKTTLNENLTNEIELKSSYQGIAVRLLKLLLWEKLQTMSNL